MHSDGCHYLYVSPVEGDDTDAGGGRALHNASRVISTRMHHPCVLSPLASCYVPSGMSTVQRHATLK